MKDSVKKIIKKLPIDFTKNQKYDKLTSKIMKIVLEPNSTFVDVGCHKGEVLDLALKESPFGSHYAFEPIPQFYQALQKKYGEVCQVLGIGLSDEHGLTTFQFVKSNPAYSGIKQRKYPGKEEIEEINVEIDTLDRVLVDAKRIDLIKIDVEGGEMGVFKGAVRVLKKFQPVVIFEHGKGASDHYGTTPEEMWDFMENVHYSIFSLSGFVLNKSALNREKFIELFETNKEYYFVAKANI